MHTLQFLKQQKRWLLTITGIFVIWAVAVTGISYYSNNVISGDVSPPGLPLNTPFHLKGLSQWDSVWYLDIADKGYAPETTDISTPDHGKAAFFPFYPALIRVVSYITRNSTISGVLISLVSAYGACIFLFLLAREQLKSVDLSKRVVLLFLFFPAAFFLSAVYAEAIFCLFSFGAFYFARQRRWWMANAFVGLSLATRSPGLIVAFAVLIEYLSTKQYNIRKLDKSAFSFVLAPLGLIAYSVYLYARFGDALMMLHAQKYWGQTPTLNIFHTIAVQIHGVLLNVTTTGYNAFGTAWSGEWTNILTLGLWIGFVYLTYMAYKLKLPLSYVVYMGLSLLYLLSKGNFISVNRYLLPLFPAYLVLIRMTAKKETAYALLLAASAVLMCFGLIEFANAMWAG